jgi:hypothetical protein
MFQHMHGASKTHDPGAQPTTHANTTTLRSAPCQQSLQGALQAHAARCGMQATDTQHKGGTSLGNMRLSKKSVTAQILHRLASRNPSGKFRTKICLLLLVLVVQHLLQLRM